MKLIRVELTLLLIVMLAVALGDVTPFVSPQATPSPTLRGPTHYPPPLHTPTPTPVVIESPSVEQQLAQIDNELKQSLTASIAFNTPTSMELGKTVTIELLLNPVATSETLSAQVTESGPIVTANVEITPRMKVVLIAQEQDAFDIRPLHDDPEQVISGTETTKWSWFVTAKTAGSHRLTIIVYRLLKFDGQDHWREVESYKADITVKVTLAQRLHEFDWKWLIGIVIPLIGVPSLWSYFMNRKKKRKKQAKM